MPYLTTTINDSNFTLVIVYFEELQNFNLQVEVIEFAVLFAPFSWYITEFSNILSCKHINGSKLLASPSSKILYNFPVFSFTMHSFTAEGKRNKIIGCWFSFDIISRLILFLKVWRKNRPRAIKTYVSWKLNFILVNADCCSMYANDFADSLWDRQVLKLSSEKDNADGIYYTVSDFAGGVDNF